MWYLLNNIILYDHYCIFSATNVYIVAKYKIICLLSIKKGTHPMKKGHIFLFSKKWGGGTVPQCPPVLPICHCPHIEHSNTDGFTKLSYLLYFLAPFKLLYF